MSLGSFSIKVGMLISLFCVVSYYVREYKELFLREKVYKRPD